MILFQVINPDGIFAMKINFSFLIALLAAVTLVSTASAQQSPEKGTPEETPSKSAKKTVSTKPVKKTLKKAPEPKEVELPPLDERLAEHRIAVRKGENR